MRRLWRDSFSQFSSFNDQKLRYKYYNKRATTRDNGNIKFHDQEECKLSSNLIAKSGVHTLIDDNNKKIIQ